MDDILLDDSLLQYLGSVDRPADPRRPAVTAPLAVPGDPLDIDLQGAYFDMKNDVPLPESRRWSHAHTRQPSLAGSFKGDPQQRPYCTAPSHTSNSSCPSRVEAGLRKFVDRQELSRDTHARPHLLSLPRMAMMTFPTAEYGNSPQSSGDRNADSGGGSGPKRGTLDGCNSGSPSNTGSGKSFKQVLAERNKQAQRRFRQRQKVQPHCILCMWTAFVRSSQIVTALGDGPAMLACNGSTPLPAQPRYHTGPCEYWYPVCTATVICAAGLWGMHDNGEYPPLRLLLFALYS